MGVDLDPGVRERPVVRWAAGPECMERRGEQGGPTVGGARSVGEQGYVSMEWVAGCGGRNPGIDTDRGRLWRGEGRTGSPWG